MLAGATEHVLEHQRGLNSPVAVVESSPPTTMVSQAMPLLDSLLIHPKGEGTTLYQGLIVLFPVADLLFVLAHLTPRVVDSDDQIPGCDESSGFSQQRQTGAECQLKHFDYG